MKEGGNDLNVYGNEVNSCAEAPNEVAEALNESAENEWLILNDEFFLNCV